MRKITQCLLTALCLLWTPQAWSQSTQLYVEDFSIAPNEKYELKVLFKGDVYITQAQFYLVIPEGFEFDNRGTERRPKYVSNTDNSAGLAPSANLPEEMNGRQLAVVLSDADQIGTEEKEGDLAIIYIKANENVAAGEYVFKLTNIIASDENAAVLTTPDQDIKVTVVKQGCININYRLHESGIGTLVLPFDAEVPVGMEVFTAIDVVDNIVILEQQETIKAGVPLIILGEVGEYVFTGVPTFEDTQDEAGLLMGTIVGTTIDAGYVLQTQNDVTGFYRVEADKVVTVPAYHCWLNYDGTAEVIGFNELFDGILALKIKMDVSGCYDLQGRKLQSIRSGLYIVNGKIVFIKL